LSSGESFKSWATRFMFNLFPCYRRTGVKVTYISPDFHEVRIKLPLNWKTRGYNGSTFGGSMYACVDPVYMTMISWCLGKQYIAWDKAATIDFRKPGRGTLYSTFRLPDDELARIRAELEHAERVERVYDVELADAEGVVHAAFRKTIQVRKRKPKALGA
jgi:acyl-coenzyme A thioesterase PaaI-like protein